MGVTSDKIDEVKLYLRAIADRLWAHRAVVLVGAGFSKNADANFPDWKGLADLLWVKLYGGNKTDNGAKNYVDVLQLAEEFAAVFGRPALDDLILNACGCSETSPSKLHVELLKLPWVDVFTTNYDVLLEQAAREVQNIKYGTVLCKEDLAYATKPRIVKLHGSIPSSRPLVLTAKDYREYKFIRAPFINTVQQALLENTVCLIGFSGDDPNFLTWIEWIHKNLGRENVQKIYLISVVSIPSSRKKLLSERGIVPIDIRALVSVNADPKRCLEACFNIFREAEPQSISWPCIPEDIEFVDGSTLTPEQIRAAIAKLSDLRMSMPQWLFTPQQERNALQIKLSAWLYKEIGHDVQISKTERMEYIFERLWLASACHVHLPSGLKVDGEGYIEQFFTRKDSCNIGEKQFRVAMQLLRTYREDGDDEKWDALWGRLQGLRSELSSDQESWLTYEECLKSIFRLNYSEAERLVEGWKDENLSAVWRVRKVGILIELGRYAAAKELAETALQTIRSIHVRRMAGDELALAATESVAMIDIRRLQQCLEVHRGAFRGLNENNHKVTLQKQVKEDSGTSDNHVDDIGEQEEERKRQEEAERQKNDRLAKEAQNEKQFYDRQYELKKIKCDMTDELKGFAISLGEFLRRHRKQYSREWGFDIHEKRAHINFLNLTYDKLCASAFLRFIELTGLTARVGNGFYFDRDLIAYVIKILWETAPRLAFVTLLQCRDKNMVAGVLTRKRLLLMSVDEVDRLMGYLLSLVSMAINEGGKVTELCDASVEIMSRLICKCSFATKEKVADLINAAYRNPNARNTIEIYTIIGRLLASCSSIELRKIILKIIPLEYVDTKSWWEARHFGHPLKFIDFHKIVLGDDNTNLEVSSSRFGLLKRQLQSETNREYEWALATLKGLLHIGCLNDDQRQAVVAIIESRSHNIISANVDYYHLLLLPINYEGVIAEKIFRRLMRPIWHGFDMIESDSDKMLIRRRCRAISEMCINALKINRYCAKFYDHGLVASLCKKVLEWGAGSKKWNEQVSDADSDFDPLALRTVRLVSELVARVIVPRLDVKEDAALLAGLMNVAQGIVWIQARFALSANEESTGGGECEAWAWENIVGTNPYQVDLGIAVLQDVLIQCPAVVGQFIDKLVGCIKCKGCWSADKLMKGLLSWLSDESIKISCTSLASVVGLLEDCMGVLKYEVAERECIPVEQCMSLRAYAVGLAVLVQKRDIHKTILDSQGIRYWLSVSESINEFAEVRNGYM